MINGGLLRDAVISAAHSISNKKKSVDELNVFPVPDGDTGTNMSMTITNSVAELENLSDDTDCSVVASTTASALLRGARGNSGVILSLIFRGFAKGLAGKKEMGANELVESLEQGVSGAYKSVMKPTEGTILTVARESAEKAREMLHSTNDPIIIMEEVCKQAELSLNETPKLLPALAKAGVVDAGGKGLLIIFEAMRDVFKGGEIVKADAPVQKQQVTVDTFAATVGQYDCEIHFTYCTEMIITKKADADDSSKLRAYLETIGDCVVVVEDDEIIKVHVHTNDPGKAIQKGLEFGYINLPKIENMKLQHKARQKEAKQEFVPAKPEKQYGFVAVAAGNGIEMTNALERVATGQVTFAARDSDYEGHAIKQGEILCIENGKLSFVEKDVSKAAYKLTKKLVKGDSSFITILYGSDVTDEAAEALQKQVAAKFSNLDVNLINGGQPVYYYIISVE